MTTSGTSPGTGPPSEDPQSGPITPSFHPGILIRFQDDSKDRDSKRKIEEDDRASKRKIEENDRDSKRKIEENEAQAQREVKKLLVQATIVMTIGISILGGIITFGHQDSKIKELGVTVISAPIAGLFGVLAGMGLK